MLRANPILNSSTCIKACPHKFELEKPDTKVIQARCIESELITSTCIITQYALLNLQVW